MFQEPVQYYVYCGSQKKKKKEFRLAKSYNKMKKESLKEGKELLHLFHRPYSETFGVRTSSKDPESGSSPRDVS